MRAVHIDDKVYTYKIGRGHVVIRSESGEKWVASLWDIKGTTPDIVERGQHKKTRDGMVCPSEIKSYLKQLLIRE